MAENLIEAKDDKGVFLTMSDDGTITWRADWPADKAAEEFLIALQREFKVGYTRRKEHAEIYNDALDDAVMVMDMYHENNLEFQIAGAGIKDTLVTKVAELRI